MGRKRIPIEYEIEGDNCHICVSHTPNEKGYMTTRNSGRIIPLHKYVYEKHNNCSVLKRVGRERIYVRRTCGTRDCINPEHLIVCVNGRVDK